MAVAVAIGAGYCPKMLELVLGLCVLPPTLWLYFNTCTESAGFIARGSRLLGGRQGKRRQVMFEVMVGLLLLVGSTSVLCRRFAM